ncbi:MAG: YbjN domain-containing protein [Brevundimonas sp.]|uniref:YbjN domain-containing protein n=1 Tax=Brevundimonas sp. TaxID=1871086 RepID=UPI00391D4CD7
MRCLALAAPIAAVASTLFPLMTGAALAQTAPATASRGLTPAEVGTWVTGLGGRVGPAQTENGLTFFTVTNAGLTWAVFFYGCEAGVCGEVQFSAVVPGAGATLDKVNAWNRDNRYLKAFHTSAETPTATVQYDVVVLSGGGVTQLADPLAVWLQLLPKFAGEMGYVAPQ